MIEEIKQDNNCIVKAFENNPISIIHENIDNKKIYCFKANDIGNVLGILNIRQSIQNYEEDERVVRKVYDPYGTLQDTLFLTSQGVYRLLYNSKKEIAKKFRKWAGNILDDIIFNESNELKRKLEEKDKELEKTKKQLELTSKLQVKKWYNQEPGHTIYAVKTNKHDTNSLITIGKSKNIANRETNYFTHNQESDMFFIRKCYNCDLTEKVLHHMLDKYRIGNNKEWFDISESLAIYIINLVCDFLDNFINSIEKLPETSLQNEIIIISKNLNTLLNENNPTNKLDNTETTQTNFNELNYDKFINECCEINDNSYIIPDEILGAYKIWSRVNVDTNRKKLLFDYIKSKFKMEKRYITKYKSKINGIIGLQVKPLHPIFSNCKLQEFLSHECNIGYIYKITEKEFLEAYSRWVKHTLTSDELINLKAELNKNFYYGNINCSKEKKKYGYVGFKLKTSKETIYCLRNKNTKKVNKINIHSKEIEETFISINETANILNIDYRTVQSYLKLKKIFNDCYIIDYA
jgi:prophage antirepressor-like protein